MGVETPYRVVPMHFNDVITINGRTISKDAPVYIIGEAGVNHNGSLDTALELVDVACKAGVDAVKFQKFKSEDLILKDVGKAPYQMKTTDTEQSQFDMLKALELQDEVYIKIMDYCAQKGITFLCTPFEEGSLNGLYKLGVDAFKVAATDLTNIQFLRQIAKKEKPMLLSAGMCYLEEIRRALEAIYPLNRNVILLQCTANYPLDDNEVNLNVIDTLKDRFDIIVGFSDHSKGVGAAPYAVAKGARVVEKHFTLDKAMKGPDHKASVTPEELERMVSEIRRVETFLGSGEKTPTYSEQATRKSLQKCFVAAKDISRGEAFTETNVVAKRTNGEGISALYYDDILNRIARKDYHKDDII